MRYGSVCSGIEAATMAWHPLGWEPAFFSEIENFPSAVLAHHYPHVPNLGDMTKFQEWPDEPIDLLVGGTPCQSFSVAGLRAGLADPRGNLALTYLAIAAKYQPRWILWENVPGVFSSLSHDAPDPCPPADPVDMELDGQEVGTVDEYDADETHAFGTFLAGLSELGYGVAYRTLDAQFCRAHGYEWAVPQRRRRVFVVGYLGDWRRAAAVLFDGASLRGDPPPCREAGQRAAPTISARPSGGGGLGTDFDLDGGLIHADVAATLPAGGNSTGRPRQPGMGAETAATMLVAKPIAFNSREDPEVTGDLAGPLGASSPQAQAIAFHHMMGAKAGGIGANTETIGTLGTKVGGGAIAIQAGALRENPSSGPDGMGVHSGVAYTVEARAEVQSVAFDMRGREGGAQFEGPHETANIRAGSGGSSKSYVAESWAVRRLTPRECERLQGFPDDFTAVPYRGKTAADGPRYKALGNSMAVNVMCVIGTRIAMVDDVQSQETAA